MHVEGLEAVDLFYQNYAREEKSLFTCKIYTGQV